MNIQKNKNLFSFLIALTALMIVVIGCDMGPSRIDSLKTSKDKDGKESSTTFKNDEPITAIAKLTSFSGKAKVKGYMTAEEDMDGLKKGQTIEGTEKTIEINDDEVAQFTFSLGENFPAGKYKITAELLAEEGKVQNSQSVEITIQKSAGSEQKSNYGPPGSGDPD